MKIIRTALVLVVTVLAISAASAQVGGLTVLVQDENGPLPGATVTISSEQGFIGTTAELSKPDGTVSFPVLRPGRGYTIEVSFPGFGTRRVSDIQIKLGVTETITVQLAEEFQERVKVTAEGDVVDLERTSQSSKFSDEFIQDLPVPGRFYQNVLTLAPGVQDADGDGNPNVHGGRDRDFKAEVSGISNVDPLTGQQMSNVNPNSIEEMEVITAGASVEFSRAQAGFARIIQKQGSNEFEGVFEFYYRSSLRSSRRSRSRARSSRTSCGTACPTNGSMTRFP
jgi:outer membrane receptor protein involved in Fe transport